MIRPHRSVTTREGSPHRCRAVANANYSATAAANHACSRRVTVGRVGAPAFSHSLDPLMP